MAASPRRASAMLLIVAIGGCHACEPPAEKVRRVTLRIDTERAAARVDPRFVSFAVDTAQVVGATFWDPAGTPGIKGAAEVPPYDFARPRLRRMTAALAPALLRIGGTHADEVFYDVGESAAALPEPYELAMTREQIDGFGTFARDLGLDILFTLNAGKGPRDESGAWQPDNAAALIEYVVARDYPVTVWELGNEVNGFLLTQRLLLSGAAFAADLARAHALVRRLDPDARFTGGSIAFWPVAGEIRPIYDTILDAGGAAHLDLLTWHYYPQQSRRCPVATRRATRSVLLDPAHLDEVARWAAYVEALRDTHVPDAPVWLGETGNAQCGGEPGISDAFEGGFWWLDQLGLLARRGQPVVIRQTLSGSDYGLIDEQTLTPNPDYFNALLWKRLMGQVVLAVDAPGDPRLRAYAHCAAGDARGAVTVLLLNLDEREPIDVTLPRLGTRMEIFSLTAPSLGSRTVVLNGEPLAVAVDGSPPPLEPRRHRARHTAGVLLPARSYAFVRLPDAGAPACATP